MLWLGGPGAGPGVRHGDTLQEAGQQLGTVTENIKAQHPFRAAETSLPRGTATGQLSPAKVWYSPEGNVERGPSPTHPALGAAAAQCGISFTPSCCSISGSFKLCTKPVVFQPAFPLPAHPGDDGEMLQHVWWVISLSFLVQKGSFSSAESTACASSSDLLHNRAPTHPGHLTKH